MSFPYFPFPSSFLFSQFITWFELKKSPNRIYYTIYKILIDISFIIFELDKKFTYFWVGNIVCTQFHYIVITRKPPTKWQTNLIALVLRQKSIAFWKTKIRGVNNVAKKLIFSKSNGQCIENVIKKRTKGIKYSFFFFFHPTMTMTYNLDKVEERDHFGLLTSIGTKRYSSVADSHTRLSIRKSIKKSEMLIYNPSQNFPIPILKDEFINT